MTQQQPQQSGGFMRQMGSVMAQGMAFGAGSEIAHQAIRGIMGGGSSGHGHQQQAPMQQAPMQQAPAQYAQPAAYPQQQEQNPCYSFN
jgi:hypothetical protein